MTLNHFERRMKVLQEPNKQVLKRTDVLNTACSSSMVTRQPCSTNVEVRFTALRPWVSPSLPFSVDHLDK